jgi:predicted N-formylglutamate amidohydrolase
VPSRFRRFFSRPLLESHRGWDPGALDLARDVARASGAPLFHSTVSRLLVELNRPLGHPQLFHLDLPGKTREALLRRYYHPYWNAVGKAVRGRGRVLHLSVHSFTPRFRGERRSTDVGLLFDPARAPEVRFCRAWRAALARTSPRLRVDYNKPYRGKFPSLVDELRKQLGPRYVGIQLEVSQKFPRGEAHRWRALRASLVTSFAEALRYAPRQRRKQK